MSETVNQEIVATEQEQPQEEKKFTQEEVNGFFKKRYSELMSQLTEYKSKAEKLDQIEESNKSELQKATERAEKLQLELDGIKRTENIRQIRQKVATETGIPASAMSLLTGETEEACQEQAKTILSMVTPASYPSVPDRGELPNINKGSARDVFKDWAAAMNN